MGDFPPLRPFGSTFPGINPAGQDPRVGTFIPDGSVGNSQLAGNLSPLKIAGLGAKVYRSTNQTITTDAATDITFDTELFDQGDFWVLGSPTYFTVPNDGVYLAIGTVEFASNTTDVRRARWKVNSTIVEGDSLDGSSSGTTRLLVPFTRSLSQGDRLSLNVYQKSGGDLDVSSGEDSCAMTIVFLFAI